MLSKKNKKDLILPIILLVISIFINGLFFLTSPAISIAAPNNQSSNSPVQMEADSISYDAGQGIILAEGNVKITQDVSIITSAKAEYNVKTKEGYLTGGVNAKLEDDTTLTAAEVRSYDNNRILAIGNVVMTKGENRLTGPEVNYYADNQYVLIPASARIETKDAVMTASKLEAFLKEERAIGTGGVHVVGRTRNLDATADKADYYGLPEKDSKVILTGNAKVIDGDNVLTGQILTVHLQEKAVDAQGGRPKLIVKPN